MVIAHYQITQEGGQPQQRYFLGSDLPNIKAWVATHFGEQASFRGLIIYQPEKNPELKALLAELEQTIGAFGTRPNDQVIELTMPEVPPHLWQKVS